LRGEAGEGSTIIRLTEAGEEAGDKKHQAMPRAGGWLLRRPCGYVKNHQKDLFLRLQVNWKIVE